MEELNINDILKFFVKKIWVIGIFTVACVILGLIYSTSIKTPLYKSTTSIILASDQTITQSDLTLYQKLINTYTQIVTSKNVLNNTISDLYLKDSYDELKKKVSVSAVTDTEIIKISVSNEDANLAKRISDSIADNFKEEVQKIYNLTNVSILDKAEVADVPYNYNLIKEFIIYIFGGILLGALYLFISYYFDRNIKSKDEVESKINLPIMGSVRDCEKEVKNVTNKNAILLSNHPRAGFVEDIKTIRTNLDFASLDQKVKKVLVTSSIPGEGKSFVSSNLAISFAQNNKKVLLIDTDLRKGVVHKKFNIKNIGLSNLIVKNDIDNINDYINKTTIDNLDVITRGIVPPNPSELLNSKVFKNILDKLEGLYDYIILDGTPITNLPDSLIVSGLSDKTLIVSTIGYTPIDLLENTKKSLENVNAPLAGIIINRVPVHKGGYYYSAYKYE
ncbi:MAG: polysaccharide biosynthesis tyrosine autokinase [Bacilli bacterium]|nr:polysaccharide biosynthesis tyrosine autokinase [Bacilli bacterium]